MRLNFDPTTHARRTDPATSHDAAASIQPAAVTLMLEVYRIIRDHGPISAWGIAARLGGDHQGSTVGRRTADLRDRRWIVEHGTEMGPKGRRVTLWRDSR